MSYSEPPTPTEVKPEDDVILSLPYCINNNNNSDVELCGVSDWDSHPENPLNWPAWKKSLQLGMLCSTSLLTYALPHPLNARLNKLTDLIF